MPNVAFYTFAMCKAPVGSETMRSFVEALPTVFGEAAKSPGFVGLAVRPDITRPPFGQDYGPWGVFAVPRFYDGGTEAENNTHAATFSLWTNIEAVHRFTYGDLHKTTLARRGDWFRKGYWPTHVMWWVPDNRFPTWQEASQKLEEMHDRGPTASAFNFGTSFDPIGQRTRVSAA